jgi:acyl-ACP thioesterase
MKENYFDKEFELRYFEMNQYAVATPMTILTLLEETAADHCCQINNSLFQLADQNIGWVLVSGFMQMERYPKYKEKIRIRTWLSKYSTVKGFRENIIYDAQDNIIGRAKGLWVFFDIERRRPVEIFEDIRNKWSFLSEECVHININKKIAAIDTADYKTSFNVSVSDTDMNKHVNNIKYLQWVIESIPDEIIDNYYLYSIDGRFIAEAQNGDTIISLTNKDEIENSFVHTMRIKGTNTLCATGKTVWRKK